MEKCLKQGDQTNSARKRYKNACVDFVELQIQQKNTKIAVASETQNENLGHRASSLTSITRWGFGELLLLLRAGLGVYHPRKKKEKGRRRRKFWKSRE